MDGQHQQHKTHNRDFTDFTRAYVTGVDAHKQRNRDGHGYGKRAPRAVNQGFHHNQGQHRQDDHHDHQNANGSNDARHRAHFLLNHVAQRFAIAAHGNEQHHHVLHRACKHHPKNNPQRARQITHLRSQYRPHQWASARNRREMVAKQHAFVRGHIVQTIVVTLCRRHAQRV